MRTSRRSVLLGLAAAPIAARAAVPDTRRLILVIGDSQAQGLGSGIQRWARAAGTTRAVNAAKPGTGFVSLDPFDWSAAIPGLLAPATPDAVVMMIGGNDRLPIRLPDGQSLPFASDAWANVYRARVAQAVRAVRSVGIPLVWVGNPIARADAYSRDMQTINALFAEVVGAEGGTFVDIWLLVSEDGHYAAHGKSLGGFTVKLRLDDGIHFTPDGYDLVAARVMQAVDGVPAAAPAAG